MGDDWFQTDPQRYQRVRPTYPAALFTWLAEHTVGRERAWDVATGTGQAAVPLTDHFREVYATDKYEGPVAAATHHRRITYRVEAAEQCSLPDASVNLVTVAAGLHWLNAEAFGTELRRVLRPEGLFAAWTYTNVPSNEEMAALFEHYGRAVIGADWTMALADVRNGYTQIDLPGEPIAAPPFHATTTLDLEGTRDLLRSWSGAIAYARRTHLDPTAQIVDRLEIAWRVAGLAPSDAMVLEWPLEFRVQRLP